MSIELALTPDGRWDVDVPTLAAATRAAGFTSLGISAGRVDVSAVAAYDAAGLRCHELLALVVGDDDAGTLASAERLTGAAATIGARWVTAVFPAGVTPERARVVARCAAMFAEAGAGIGVEVSPLGAVPAIAAGLEVIAAAAPHRAGLVIDTWHFFFGAGTWDDLTRLPLERIAYVQFTDAPPLVSDDLVRETMHRRAMPGEGTFDLDRFASTLLTRGWDGVVSVEVLNRELRSAPIAEVVQRAYDTTARYWR